MKDQKHPELNRILHELVTVSSYLQSLLESISDRKMDIGYCRDLTKESLKKLGKVSAGIEKSINESFKRLGGV